MTKLIHPLLIHLMYILQAGVETNATNDTCKFPIKLNSLKPHFALVNQERIFLLDDAALVVIKTYFFIKTTF